jgi:hypothetical protein
MSTLDAMAARRSIRTFKADPVPADLLQTIFRTSLQAPSGKNKQPWRRKTRGLARSGFMMCSMPTRSFAAGWARRGSWRRSRMAMRMRLRPPGRANP